MKRLEIMEYIKALQGSFVGVLQDIGKEHGSIDQAYSASLAPNKPPPLEEPPVGLSCYPFGPMCVEEVLLYRKGEKCPVG